MPSKRKLFIGSSGESLHIAEEVKNILSSSFPQLEICIWKDTKWKQLKSVLDNLNKYVNEFYYSIFIGYPDDLVFERGQYHYISRDNVLFEFGYFLSIMGIDRTFLILPDNLNYSSQPIQHIECNIPQGYKPPFKILTDIGKNLITSRYNLNHGFTNIKDSSGNTKQVDKWTITANFNGELSSLISQIQENEEYIENLKSTADEEIKNRGELLSSEIKKCKAESDEYKLNKFSNNIDELLILRSYASQKELSDTIIDIIELIYKVDDLLDIEQLSIKQSYRNNGNKFKKVWVFADSPIEFDNKTEKYKRELILKTILENLEDEVEYRYITSHHFQTTNIDNYLFCSIDQTKVEKYRKQITVTQIEPKYFKTYFTLHFPHTTSTEPEEIYMSALIPKRDDLLVKISDIHFKRVFERIKKLVGYKPSDKFEVTNYVVTD